MTSGNPNARLEALCDGVFAIAMTLLIIDVRIPAMERIATTSELWHALQQVTPSVFAFVLSFGVILISWVNHHATMKLVSSSSASFIYANGFLLLTVVSLPFPTQLLGAFLWTDQAAPAVMLYNAVLALQAFGWILVTGSALNNHLTADERSTVTMRESDRNGKFAFAFYAVLAVAALKLPLEVSIVTPLSWLYWLVRGMRMRHV